MRLSIPVLAVLALACTAQSTGTNKEAPAMTSLSGKSIRWTFTDGPMAGTPIEHFFDPNGSGTWRIVDGPNRGLSKVESEYAAEQIDDHNWAVSYLSTSGYTLTVVLNFANHRAIGFASNDKTWVPQHGTFEVVP